MFLLFTSVTCNPAVSVPPHPGLKAGDEILSLNGKPASDLQMDDMKAAFAGHMLTLSVSTLPQLDPKVLCSCPPRRSDVEQETATDIFSQSQGKTAVDYEINRSVHLHYKHSPSNPQTWCSEDKGALLPAGDKRWGLVIL